MPHEDLTHYQARQLLMGEAAAAELYARRCEVAMAEGDAAAARRWNRRYALSAFRCRTLGALLRMWATCCPSPALRLGVPDGAPSDSKRSQRMTHAEFPSDHGYPDGQVDELLGRIRALVLDRGILETDGASELELRANRQAILRLQQRLAELVQRQHRDAIPPAA